MHYIQCISMFPKNKCQSSENPPSRSMIFLENSKCEWDFISFTILSLWKAWCELSLKLYLKNVQQSVRQKVRNVYQTFTFYCFVFQENVFIFIVLLPIRHRLSLQHIYQFIFLWFCNFFNIHSIYVIL